MRLIETIARYGVPLKLCQRCERQGTHFGFAIISDSAVHSGGSKLYNIAWHNPDGTFSWQETATTLNGLTNKYTPVLD